METKKKLLVFFICVATLLSLNGFNDKDDLDLDEWAISGWSISKELFDCIKNLLPKGSTILELGSGWASEQLSKLYTVYSIEHDKKWLNKYDTNYIYAPIKNGWYDANILKRKLPSTYKLILVDGPPEKIGRGKFYDHLWLFDTDVIIIFDDVNRKIEYNLMVKVAKKLKRKFIVSEADSFDKKFGILLN